MGHGACEDGLGGAAVVVASRGGTELLGSLIECTGYAYPQCGVGDWNAGGFLC